MRKSFIRLYSLLLCAALALLTTRKTTIESRMAAKTTPTKRDVSGVVGSEGVGSCRGS
jgi:hypothetical protein